MGVYSLDDALDLVARRGYEEEVEVRVMGCMLRDVPELREVLRERIMERHWGVVHLSRLRPFVQVDDDVGAAAEILIGIIRVNYNPVNRIVDAARTEGPAIVGRGLSLRQARMTWARGLGRLLESLGGAMQRGLKRPAKLRKSILSAHTRCRQVSERYISTTPVRRGRNLIQQYMENL